jgi:hypothetical protein
MLSRALSVEGVDSCVRNKEERASRRWIPTCFPYHLENLSPSGPG